MSLFRYILVLVAAGWLARGGSTASATPPDSNGKIAPSVFQAAVNGEVDCLVIVKGQADIGEARKRHTKALKGEFVYTALINHADRSQRGLRKHLQDRGKWHRAFWLANVIEVKADLAELQELAAREDVERIVPNATVHLLDDVKVEPSADSGDNGLQSPSLHAGPSINSIEWNITKINAPSLWAQGINGQGIVVGGIDTGVQWNHPALINQYRGYDRVNVTTNHNYNWLDTTSGTTAPVDPHSHGTHTVGTMVGNDLDPSNPAWPAGASHAIGVAPGAQWIHCRAFDVTGNATDADILECFQWFLAPTDLNGNNPDSSKAPDVINNSWGCYPYNECGDVYIFQTMIQNLRAAGIFVVFSAGNNGPSCSTIATPALHAESFAVGATDSNDNIASFSSRGASAIDGSNRTKPNVSAPGDSVNSSVPGSAYGGKSGTSMAAPHVAGLTALLLSGYPALVGDLNRLARIIENSALPRTDAQSCAGLSGSVIPNNTYGRGRIDAVRAQQPDLSVTSTTSAPTAVSGHPLTYTLTVLNDSLSNNIPNVTVTNTLPAGASFVSATPTATASNGVVVCGFGTLANGTTTQLVINATIGLGPPRTLTNVTVVTGTAVELVTANNTYSALTPAVASDRFLTLLSPAGGGKYLASDILSITWTNSGGDWLVNDMVRLEYSTNNGANWTVGSSRVDLQACKLEYSIVSPK